MSPPRLDATVSIWREARSRWARRMTGRAIVRWLATALGLLGLAAPGRLDAQTSAKGEVGLVQPWFRWTPLDDPDAGAEPLLDRDAPPPPYLEGLTWKSAFEQREVDAHDGRMLIGWRARASSALWAGTLTGDVDLLAMEPPDGVGLDTEARRWLRLALRERWGPVTLGLRLESASRGLERVTAGRVKSETQGGEAWLEGRDSAAGLRLSGGRFWDNLANYPWQPRTTRTQGGAAADVRLPVGATLTVAYQGGTARREPAFRPRSPQTAEEGRSTFHGLTGSLSCGGSAWTLTVSSSYTPSRDEQDRETVSVTHDLSATLRLSDSITITPAIGLAEDAYEWSGDRSRTTSASIAVSWTSVLEGVDLSVSGSFARNLMSGDAYDATAVNAAAGVVWRLRQVGPTRTTLAFEVGSNHYLDRVTPSAGYAEVYGVVTLRVASF